VTEPTQPQEGSAVRDPIEAMLDEYLTARRGGSSPDLAPFLTRAGARAGELRELIESATMLDDLKGSRPRGLSLHTPQVLGDYRIVAEIGRGGMGVVYEAEQITLGRRVALKVLPPQALRGESRLQRFKREAQTAAKLHHSNIVPIFGVGEQDGVHYYVMQLIVGRPLDEVLRALRGEKAAEGATARRGSGSMALSATSAAEALRAGAFAPRAPGHGEVVGPGDAAYYRSVAACGLQVADALTYAHAQGTLHRDVKPGNLIMDAHGVVWVTDFGLAKVVEDDTFTRSGDVVGTLQYMAPEQFGGQADERTDVHGLGLVLYEMLTLRPAFAADSRGELVDRVKNQEPVAAGRLRPGVPKDLETIVRKATAKDPRHRYATAGELRDDLDRFLQDRPIRARPVSTLESGWRWCRRNRLLASVGAVAVLGLVSTAVVGMLGFASTRRALQRAVTATARAEGNVAVALSALESVFARVVGPDMLRPDDDEEGDVVAPGVVSGLSAADQELLSELLRAYDQLATSNRGNAAARQLAARAYHRVGEIHLQLHKLNEAVANYERASSIYAELVEEGSVGEGTLMQVDNGLCRALSNQAWAEWHAANGAASAEEGRRLRERAGASTTRAAEVAASVLARGRAAASPSALARFECARAHELLSRSPQGRGTGRRGGDRGQRDARDARDREPGEFLYETQLGGYDHYRAALALYETLMAEEPANATYRHATARACLGLAMLLPRRPRDATRREELAKEVGRLQRRAIELFESLVQQSPRRSQYRQELVTALTLQPIDVPWSPGRRSYEWGEPLPATAEQVAWHRRGVELAEALVLDFPGVAEFDETLRRVAIATATMLVHAAPAEAGALAKRAVALAEAALSEAADGDARRRVCDTAMRAAGVLLANDPEAAQNLARRAVAVADAMAAGRGDDRWRGTARRRLVQTLWRTGAGEEAWQLYQEGKARHDAHEHGLFDAAELRVLGAAELLRAGDVARARVEAHEADACLKKLETTRESDGRPGRPGFGDPLPSLGRDLAEVYEDLSRLDAEPDEVKTQDRARAQALKERFPERREPTRRN